MQFLMNNFAFDNFTIWYCVDGVCYGTRTAHLIVFQLPIHLSYEICLKIAYPLPKWFDI